MKNTILVLLLLGAALLSAQSKDLKVGLVLSGGGARGYAHIGALQVLEEAGVRVDYIGGTSMGSIVGGLYASGYTAFQLEKMLRATDIMAELQDAIGRENRTIYEKLYNEHYLIGLSLKDFAIQLPTALSDGQRIHDLFSHWTANVHTITDFSKLPTPFLCVGTDIETGEAVVLETGKLADAMRASAALPGVITPYKMNGHIMTDGGVSNNYPAEEVKNKGMDYVIGITVEQDPYTADEINSLDKLLMQIAFFQATRRNIEQYAITDIDIKPDLGDYSQLSFEAIDDLIKAGRLAAEAQLATLDSIALQQQSRPPADTVSMPESLNATIVEILGNEDLSRRQVLSFFGGDLPGNIDWLDFREGLVALFATGRYANVDYHWEAIPGKEDEVKLVLDLKQSPNFGQRLRLGLHYDQEYRSNILVGLTLSDLIIDNTQTTLDLIGGSRFRYRVDFRVNRVNGSAFGLRSRLHYADIGFDLPEIMGTPGGLLIERLDFHFNDLNAELYWDFRQTDNSFTGIAAEIKYYQNTSEQLAAADSSSLFRLGDDNYFVPNAYFLYDKLDDRHFPMSGFSIDAKTRAIINIGEPLAEGHQWAINGDFHTLLLFPLSKKISLGTELNAGGFLETSSLPYRYYLGSNNRNLMNNFKLFPSLELGEASGDNLLMGEFFTRFHPGGGHYFTLGARTARLGNAEGLPTSIRQDWLVAGRLTYGLSSPLGPIELTYAHGNTGRELYFNLGYWF
ncbi:MAG: NTE family protein [Neolewinella sp.]